MSRIVLYGNNGSRHAALVSHGRHDVSHLQGAGSIRGLDVIRLADGTPLNYVDENTFQNVATGEMLSRNPPSK
jgi:hypothetical protein